MSKMLLLADDSVTIQKVVELIFAHSDYGLKCVGNGDEALEQARLSRPDIILADAHMPGRNGYDLCAAVKADPALNRVPVLMLAGAFEPFDEEKARSVGADGWIAKPFESQSLMDEVEGLLSRSADAAAASASSEEESDLWADLGLENADAGSGEGEQWIDDEEPFVTSAPTASPEPSSAALMSEEPGFAAEEEFLFIDESDLLEDEQVEMESPAESDLDDFVFDESEETESETLPETMTEEPEVAFFPNGKAEVLPETIEPDMVDAEPAEFAMAEPETAELEMAEPELTETETTEPEPATNEPAARAAFPIPAKGNGLDYFKNAGLISRLAEPPKVEIPAPEPIVWPQEDAPVQGLTEVDVEQRVQALSEEQLNQIVERVAGAVIERLAGSILEKIAWEVVPDLAEAMIKEEIRKITETSH
ncbi:MAG: response regulator [Syntrophotaleaceae bacterium]